MRTYEAYETNAGMLAIFALDGDRVAWSMGYHGAEYEAAQDWCGLIVQGLDPMREGWDDGALDLGEFEGLARKIGDSRWDHLPLGVDVDRCGRAGQMFAMHAGAASICSECGSIIPAVRGVDYPDSWRQLGTCPACGSETLTD